VTDDLLSPIETKPSIPVGQIATGAVLIVIGVGWLLSALDIATIPWRALLAGVLIVIGIALAAAAAQGAAPAGLVPTGMVLVIVLALLSTASSAFSIPLRGGVGDRNYRPTTATLDTEYRLIAGQMNLDLRGVEFPVGETRIEASVTFGKLVVEGFPADVAVSVTGKATAGEIDLFDSSWDGVGIDERATDAGFDEASTRLVIETAVVFGQIEVRR
jgi:hypothetical protein